MSQNSKTLIGALVAAALAIAVYYGVIGQQTANNIQTQTNQALGSGPAGTPAQPQTQTVAPQAPVAPVPVTPAPQPTAPTTRP